MRGPLWTAECVTGDGTGVALYLGARSGARVDIGKWKTCLSRAIKGTGIKASPNFMTLGIAVLCGIHAKIFQLQGRAFFHFFYALPRHSLREAVNRAPTFQLLIECTC
jgi:hypothetical protein